MTLTRSTDHFDFVTFTIDAKSSFSHLSLIACSTDDRILVIAPLRTH